ncbi:ABC transporter ATP-binding protein [Pyramidobacter sp.]|uniref:ABC transporter ATP-binding protein n=1 Tax=Pyramidobacter sp. TaxID=1943581 RepID=UPI0039C5AAE1
MAEPILNVDNVHVFYGSIHAVKGISFEVFQGEIVTLIGANGAGKSTTLNAISGLLPRTGGVSFFGRRLAKVPPYKVVELGLAQVPEGRRIFLHMSVQENLEMGAYTRHAAGAQALAADLETVFALFPRLKERRRQIAGTLSGGEQQMLAMGRALMSRPKLLMLDEPSMGLAPLLVEAIFDIIGNLHANGATILLVEQNARMALSIADRGYVLETGRIVATGTGRELLDSSAIKKAYLGG